MGQGVYLHALLYLTVLLSSFDNSFAQVDFDHYRPRSNHSAGSTDLIESVKHNLRQETFALNESEKIQVVKRLNAERTRLIVDMVQNGAFIKDDSLETYVNTILQTILKSNGITITGHPRVLILDSPEINAYCFGQGIYIVSIGLLGRIDSEDELAFTIAHEVAHDVLGHIKTRLVQEAEVSLAKKSREQIRKILSGTISVKDVHEYKTLIYGASQHNRVREMQADSTGISLMQRAAYDQDAASSMLTVLDESLEPKFDIGLDLIWPLNSTEYPLQEGWFEKRLSIYSRVHTDSYLYSADSVESHPDIALRKTTIAGYIRSGIVQEDHQSEEFADAVTLLAEFETLQSAYEKKAFDRCLYYALQLLNRYPQNPFLISRIGKVLISLYEAKSNNDNSFRNYVPRFTAYYSDELTLVNNMLHNLSTKELGELTFHFLDDPERFNKDERSHYYLLWRVSDLTYRKTVADDIRRWYKERFDSNITGYEVR